MSDAQVLEDLDLALPGSELHVLKQKGLDRQVRPFLRVDTPQIRANPSELLRADVAEHLLRRRPHLDFKGRDEAVVLHVRRNLPLFAPFRKRPVHREPVEERLDVGASDTIVGRHGGLDRLRRGQEASQGAFVRRRDRRIPLHVAMVGLGVVPVPVELARQEVVEFRGKLERVASAAIDARAGRDAEFLELLSLFAEAVLDVHPPDVGVVGVDLVVFHEVRDQDVAV